MGGITRPSEKFPTFQTASKYPYNELYLNNSSSPTGYVRVDSYNPSTGEIISRKFTQLAQIQTKTAVSYVKEAATKYKSGSSIAYVPSTPVSLRGQTLRGQVILEVPVQTRAVPIEVLREAKQQNVIIRDNNGKTY